MRSSADGRNDARRRLEQPLAGGHLVDDGAERPDVAAMIGAAAVELLGRHTRTVPAIALFRGDRTDGGDGRRCRDDAFARPKSSNLTPDFASPSRWPA